MLNLKKGFSVIEILFVLAIMIILAAIVLPSFKKMRENQVLKSTTSEVISVIDKARSQSVSSIDSSEYGVHFQTDKVVLFKGITYSSSDASNENIILTTPATISVISLTGGAVDVYFDRLSGAPSKSGTITISVSSLSKTITISATGTASTN
jgi:Tfp pilus assembly protein FimT